MTPLPPYRLRQAGIGTYTGNNVLGTPIVQAASELLDQMIAWNLPEHIKGLPSFFCFHPTPNESSQTVIGF